MAVRASEAARSCTGSEARTGVVGCVVEVAVLVVLGASVRGTITNVTEATSGATSDVLGNTLKLVVALLTAAKDSTLGLELVHGHGWQRSGLMVGSSIVVDLVNGDGGVHNVGLNDLLLNNGLNGLVDVLELC
jgi:hypothetical protein